MNMMNTTGMNYGSSLFWLHVHWFFSSFAIVGFILLTVWALKNLSSEKLKSLLVGFLVVGIVGSLFTAPFVPWGVWHRGGSSGKHNMDWQAKVQMHAMMKEHLEEVDGAPDHEALLEMKQGMMR